LPWNTKEYIDTSVFPKEYRGMKRVIKRLKLKRKIRLCQDSFPQINLKKLQLLPLYLLLRLPLQLPNLLPLPMFLHLLLLKPRLHLLLNMLPS